MRYNWKIGGEAGFGIVTSGLVFSKIVARSGYHLYDYAEYPSLIRGGHNTYDVAFSDDIITSSIEQIDMLVCLNEATYTLHKNRLSKNSVVIYDSDEFSIDNTNSGVAVSFKKIRKEQDIQFQMVNTIAVGASLALLGGDISIFEDILRSQFSRKGQEVIDFNIKLAKIGYEACINNPFKKNILSKKTNEVKLVLAGNEAFSLGAVVADCRYFAAYPMTPASSVLTSLATWQKKSKMVVRHSEDEIAVINSALGASFAGVRSAVATSGGGFALMVEALSYSGIAEIPIVVFLSMRPGPATGMPTWTETADLLFAVHSGHGEFPKIVLAPGDSVEMLELTLKAFDLADIYQTPVLVLSDKCLSESHQDFLKSKIDEIVKNHKPNRGKIVKSTNSKPYLRYKIENDGISEMLIPGQQDIYYQANSYEHFEDSHTSEESDVRVAQVDKRHKKLESYLSKEFKPPVWYGEKDADTIFVSWGGMKGAIVEAQKLLKDNHGLNTGFIHFTHIHPLDENKLIKYFDVTENSSKRYILVENNSQGQFGQLLRMNTGINIKEKLLKYDGRPILPEEIVQKILNLGNINQDKNPSSEEKIMTKLEQKM